MDVNFYLFIYLLFLNAFLKKYSPTCGHDLKHSSHRPSTLATNQKWWNRFVPGSRKLRCSGSSPCSKSTSHHGSLRKDKELDSKMKTKLLSKTKTTWWDNFLTLFTYFQEHHVAVRSSFCVSLRELISLSIIFFDRFCLGSLASLKRANMENTCLFSERRVWLPGDAFIFQI